MGTAVPAVVSLGFSMKTSFPIQILSSYHHLLLECIILFKTINRNKPPDPLKGEGARCTMHGC